MAATTPKTTSIREAIATALETIDGTGDFWNDASGHVIEGPPDHKKMMAFPCIFFSAPGRGAGDRNISRGVHDFTVNVTVWACIETKTPFDDVEKIEQDVVRVVMDNTGLGCNATMWRFESSEYDTDEIDRQSGRVTVGVCKIETEVTSRETF